MAPLPTPRSPIPDLIFKAREAAAQDWDSIGFSPSEIGHECDRRLWLSLRWAAPKEKIPGRIRRIFETGEIEERRIIADLRMIGVEVWDIDEATGRQFSVRTLGGHVRGKLDGVCRNVPEAPAKWHILECKSHNDKSFKKLVSQGVQKVKFDHWTQMQIYMHVEGIDRALYGATNKNDDDIYYERVKYDHDYCVRTLARLERILRSPTPPPKIAQNPEAPDCKWCPRRAICWGGSFARVNCRTCVHSSPEMHGDAAWSCARWAKPLTTDEQRAACEAHLFIPDLVPGELIDADEVAETITYRLADGRMWTDGREPSPAPVEVEADPDTRERQ